ncbi:conserved Plasmodium protein, unknown function [Plasmodium berghei]|uniref:PDCD2 domain-containing protein, putative n=2 Tax=Plasmodium berghei TaxID=5821 RepID=A0A509AH48_PLABA|nr:PDCD2 domain-containing protein, putative [Plasmodium berghei ANKA]CXI18530.1 conserved Plasmodium protein, unknown function [Plasmodium berghei]SCM19783.1 conserved Plasmodium protein, unknown function [Plasmodium berghei]SCN23524.1 conserved Plasmodium protein, unknown function [Plasmodium berghei]SCO59126.1 conserved Plasmodium protein, unknown function [Plasmodium berghei]SCO59845.1 conserved Plasmodium protein, unknown function [Plasmodium berghei]|eukprot:XP_034420639.1 PDCD2 domain-containing protein, putative [Plasmodium berghei ANKA]
MKNVLLGYVKKGKRFNELNNKKGIEKKFVSKIGGKPYWLDIINLPEEDNFKCIICNKLLSFLLQIYAPIDNIGHCFHRCLYLFVCFKCGDQVKCFRTQLPRNNPFYNFYLNNNLNTNPNENDSNSSESDQDNIEMIKNGQIQNKFNELSNFENEANEFTTTENDSTDNDSDVDVTKYRELYSTNLVTASEDLNNSTTIFTDICSTICPDDLANTPLHLTTTLNKTEIVKNKDGKLIEKSTFSNINKVNNINKEIFDKNVEYLLCCNRCGIPCKDKKNNSEKKNNKFHKQCEMKKHIIILENKIHINDEYDCESSSIGSDSYSDESEEYNEKDQIEKVDNDDEVDITEMKAMEDIQKEVFKNRQIDNVFLNYIKKISRFPKQIIRYSYKGNPLYATNDFQNKNKNNIYSREYDDKKKSITFENVPNCYICKKRKVFEFQVLSTIINYLKIKNNNLDNQESQKNLKFMTINIYTCENNCDVFDVNITKQRTNVPPLGRYIQEYVHVEVEN